MNADKASIRHLSWYPIIEVDLDYHTSPHQVHSTLPITMRYGVSGSTRSRLYVNGPVYSRMRLLPSYMTAAAIDEKAI